MALLVSCVVMDAVYIIHFLEGLRKQQENFFGITSFPAEIRVSPL